MKFLPIAVIALLLSVSTFGQHHSDQIKKIRTSLKKTVLYPENKTLFRVNQEFKEKLDSMTFEDFYEDGYKSKVRLKYNNDWTAHTAYIDVYSFTAAKWFTETKLDYDYNGSGRVLEITELWKDDDRTPWYNYEKVTFSYTSAGYIEYETTYRWDEDKDSWLETHLTEYLYSDGHIVASFNYNRNKENTLWDQHSYTAWIIGKDNLISEVRYFSFDNVNNNWKGYQYTSFIYDNHKNVIQEDDYTKNRYKDEDEWEYTSRHLYNYDKSVLYSELATFPAQQYATGELIVHKPVKIEHQPSYFDWKTVTRQLYYYSVLTPTGLTSYNNQTIQLYPNPATDLVRFETPSDFSGNGTVEIFNMQGMKVLSSAYQSNRFSVAGLEKGMYQVKVSDLQNNYSGKLIVR